MNVEEAAPFPRMASPPPSSPTPTAGGGVEDDSVRTSLHHQRSTTDNTYSSNQSESSRYHSSNQSESSRYQPERIGYPSDRTGQPPSERPVHPSETIFNSLVSSSGSSPILAPYGQNQEYEHNRPQIMNMGGFPFYLASAYNPELNEKYQQLMKKKQKKARKSGEKNVKAVKKSEEVEGYEGDKDVNTLLRSLGETADDDKKQKPRKQKSDKIRGEKKRKSLEKSSEEDEGKEEEEENSSSSSLMISVQQGSQPSLGLVSPEPSELSRLKTGEALTGSTESLNFTQVRSKKNRGRRRGEETGKPPPGPPPGDTRRTSNYALRSRDVPPPARPLLPTRGSGTSSPVESLTETHQVNNRVATAAASAVVVVEVNSLVDFPALRPHPENSASTPLSGSAAAVNEPTTTTTAGAVVRGPWSAIKTTNPPVENRPLPQSGHNPHQAPCDTSAVININNNIAIVPPHVPAHQSAAATIVHECSSSSSDDVIVTGEKREEETLGGEGEEVTAYTSSHSISMDSSVNVSRNIFEENIGSQEDISDTSSSASSSSCCLSSASYLVDRPAVADGGGGGGVVVFDTKTCLARDLNGNFFTEKLELEFGFDLNPELLKGSCVIEQAAEHETGTPKINSSNSSSGGVNSAPEAAAGPRSPIDAVDTAILSFGPAGVGGGLPASMGGGPMMIPVAPFGMFPANGLPPPFSAPYLPFPLVHQMERYPPETELAGPGGGAAAGEAEAGVSPESGISSASPLSSPSLHPDSSPVLQARPPQESSCMLEQVNTSLEAWSGHSSSSSSSPSSSRTSPAPGWATQVDMSFGTGEPVVEAANCSNYHEIVTFIQKSWSVLATDAEVTVYKDSPQPHQ